MIDMCDELVLGGRRFNSRFILGSGKFSLEMTRRVIEEGGVEMATLAVRRANAAGEGNVLDSMPEGITLLPNTSGARTAEEAVRIARLARELECGDFVKVEIIRDTKYLLPDNRETVRAVGMLADEGFIPMPYMMPDLTAARDPHRVQQRSPDQGLRPHDGGGARRSRDRGRGHREAVPGLRGDGAGMCRGHG